MKTNDLKRRITLLNLFLFLLLSVNGMAQEKAMSNILTVAQMHQDIDILKKELETTHPALYLYTSKEEMDAAFAKLKQEINQSLTTIEFYRQIAPLNQLIKNGHNIIFPSENWMSDKRKNGLFLPLSLYKTKEGFFVLKNFSNADEIQEGAELLSINGESSTEIFQELMNNYTSDGYNETLRVRALSEDFREWYAIIKGMPAQYDLVLKTPDGTQQSVLIEALSKSKMEENALVRYKQAVSKSEVLEKLESHLSLQIDEEVAILKVPEFGDKSKGVNGKKYNRFHKEAFRQIKEAGVQHLILDLRDNGGGSPKPQLALLTHLIDEPVRLYTRTYSLVNKLSSKELYGGSYFFEHLLFKMAFNKEGDIYVQNNGLVSKMMGSPSHKAAKPAKNVYKGKLYVLMNGGSFSATGEVLGHLKSHNRGVFIGEESGGNPVQNTSGLMPVLTLPNSNIRVLMTLLCFENNISIENNGYGLKPDHHIKNSITDELNGHDAVMKFTEQLIQESQAVVSQNK